MMTSQYAPGMSMNLDAPAPDPGALSGYASTYADGKWRNTNPLAMLRLAEAVRVGLRAYDESCVAAARRAGATWDEIGQATGMARQNAQRKWGHVG